MERQKSLKKVLSLEECCHPFKTIFIKGNCENSVMVSVNEDVHYYSLNQEVELTEPDWRVIRETNKVRHFYEEVIYDPFGQI